MLNNIWVTSDTHWNHKNLVRGTTEWDLTKKGTLSVRDFDTLEKHNATIINNINSVVKHDDILWHLGDWSFGGEPNIKKFRDQLNCQTINLVLGNHDHHIERNPSNYKQLFTTIQHYAKITINKQEIVLSHFAFRVWDKMAKGAIHLYGHSHGSLPGQGRSQDVGLDTNSLMPYNILSLIDILVKKPIEIVDHHTNN